MEISQRRFLVTTATEVKQVVAPFTQMCLLLRPSHARARDHVHFTVASAAREFLAAKLRNSAKRRANRFGYGQL
jgi:hypothetical protein